VKRRDFITLLGGAAASVAGAQQPTAVIGYLGAGTARSSAYLVSILNQSLSAAGVEILWINTVRSPPM
jgi:hypothetical protein